MKRIAVILLAVLPLACQPTPEVDAVKQKDTVQMIETVKEADAQRADAPETSATEQMPERLKWDFYTETQQAHIVADVPVTVLSDGDFPLLRVERRKMTAEQNLALCKALLGTDTVYRLVPQEATQAEIAEEIRLLTEMLADPVEGNPLFGSGDDKFTQEEIDEMIPVLEERLEQLRVKYLSADDGSQGNAVWDGSIGDCATVVPSAFDFNAMQCDCINFTDGTEGTPYYWGADYCKKGNYGLGWGYNLKERIDPSAYGTARPDLSITPRDAIETAQALMAPYMETTVAGVYWDDDATDTSTPGKLRHHAYTVHLMPVYHNGASGVFLSTWTDSETIGSGEDAYRYMWPREQISVTVNDDGILRFDWQSPLSVTEVVGESCPLLPFSEIEQIAKQQLNRLSVRDSFKNSTLTVRAFTLGLVRIAEPYQMDRALLTPVWCLFGEWKQDGSDDLYLASDNVAWPILEINAIDGTIIDPEKGY